MKDMLPEWESRLGGAQQFMSTHCFTMAESGRVDPTVQAYYKIVRLYINDWLTYLFFLRLKINHMYIVDTNQG